jgi:protein involved in polysaccharide export with SLBB domain
MGSRLPTRTGFVLLAAVLGGGLLLAQQGARIVAHDKLTIAVFNAPPFSGTFRVGADGAIQYPELGAIKVAGLTPLEVSAELTRRLSASYIRNPQVTVEVESSPTKKVTVSGEVRAPNVYPFGGDLTLLDAVTLAQSVTEKAADEVLVYHGGSGSSEPLRVNLREILDGRSMAHNLDLHDGDVVVVPAAEPVYVKGEVNAPGAIYPKGGTTIEESIVLAGGIKPTGSYKKIKLQRSENGKLQDVKFKDYKTETVQPGDILTVGRSIL